MKFRIEILVDGAWVETDEVFDSEEQAQEVALQNLYEGDSYPAETRVVIA